jgi:hypothetical protein
MSCREAVGGDRRKRVRWQPLDFVNQLVRLSGAVAAGKSIPPCQAYPGAAQPSPNSPPAERRSYAMPNCDFIQLRKCASAHGLVHSIQ